jgi:hypothetical protein
MAETPIALTLDQVRRFRMERSGLLTPFATPEEAASALVGIQAQILPAAGLALWNRTRTLDNVRFEEAIFTRRTLVKLWGQRGTLHLYPSGEWPLIHGARAVNRTWWERRAAQGVHGELDGNHRRMVEAVATALRTRESMGRTGLRALQLDLHEDFYSGWGGIFADVVRLGYACHAERVGGEGHFAHREVWLPDLKWNPPDPLEANLELVRRYLRTYGPATPSDLGYWRGEYVGPVRAWLNALRNETIPVQMDGEDALAHVDDRETLEALAAMPKAADGLPVRMLYRFDPLLLAHRSRAWVVDADYHKRVARPAGHIEGVVLYRGKAVATWRYDRIPAGLQITVSPFKPLPKAVTGRIPRHSEGVARFFDLSLADVRVDAP